MRRHALEPMAGPGAALCAEAPPGTILCGKGRDQFGCDCMIILLLHEEPSICRALTVREAW